MENKCLERDEMVVLLFAYINHLNYAKNLLDAYNSIFNCRRSEEKLQKINLSSGFFKMAESALSKIAILEYSKLFNKKKTENTIAYLINKVRSNQQLFVNKSVGKMCDEIEKKMDSELASVILKLKKRRDKDLAHNDYDYFDGFQNPAIENYVSPDDLENLYKIGIDFCFILFDELLVDNVKMTFETGADDLDNLLDRVSSGENTNTGNSVSL